MNRNKTLMSGIITSIRFSLYLLILFMFLEQGV